MKISKEFLVTVIVVLVIFAGTQQYVIEGYDRVTDQLLVTVDKLLAALVETMT